MRLANAFFTQHELEDRLASEQRAFKRDQRRTRRKQQSVKALLVLLQLKLQIPDFRSLFRLLEDEEARLQAFRPARKANEQDEASEIAAKVSLPRQQSKNIQRNDY